MTFKMFEVLSPVELKVGYSVGLVLYADDVETPSIMEYSAMLCRPDNTIVYTETRENPTIFLHAIADMKELGNKERIQDYWKRLNKGIRKANIRERLTLDELIKEIEFLRRN